MAQQLWCRQWQRVKAELGKWQQILQLRNTYKTARKLQISPVLFPIEYASLIIEEPMELPPVIFQFFQRQCFSHPKTNRNPSSLFI